MSASIASSVTGTRPPTPTTAVPDAVRPYRFQWDPSNRLPGPESVTSDGRGVDAIPQLGNLNLNFSTTNLSLGSVPEEWSSARHGFNAISTVLNNPHKPQDPPKAHHPLPSVPPAELPRVRRKDFDPYLSSISDEWARFENAHRNTEAGPSAPQHLPPLVSVPSVFFTPNFSLTDAAIFAAVTDNEDPTSLAHSLPLIEKLSHYADVVETHLTHEISERSSSFFAALHNLNHLHAESTQCLTQIANLRTMLEDVGDNVAKRGLQVVQRETRINEIQEVSAAVEKVSNVVELSARARSLPWHDALDVVDRLEKSWNPPVGDVDVEGNALSIPLSALDAFSVLPDHLRALTLEITSSLSAELSSALKTDLFSRIQGSTSEDALKRTSEPLVAGLTRTKGIREAILSWREVALSEIGTLVPENLKELPQPEFLDTLRITFDTILKALDALHIQGIVVGQVLQATQSNQETLQDDFTDLLGSATELAHSSLAKIVSARADKHTALPLPEFDAFFSATWSFVISCEVVCKRMVVSLRAAAVAQGKTWLQAFHQLRLTQSAKLVEDELWNPKETAGIVQTTVDRIVESAVRDVKEDRPMKPAGKMLQIEERNYFTVHATSDVLLLLADYLKVIVNLDMLITDTMSRAIEFLKAFNSRTCQVVLGAGAMRSAGLKNITAKHLALASQSLSIMISLIPYVRETFRRHLSAKQAVMLVEFDKLKRDYQEHQNEIHAKLVAIMGDRLSAHIKTLKVVDWNTPKAGVNDYMELLMKETVTLNKVLSRYLAPAIVQDVMTQVFAAINHRLSGEYAKIELPSLEAKERLLADARYLRERMAGMQGMGGALQMLETVVQEKSYVGMPSRLRASSPVPAPPSPQRSATLPPLPHQQSPVGNPTTVRSTSTNLRLKGLLTRGLTLNRGSSEKELPMPSPMTVDVQEKEKEAEVKEKTESGANGFRRVEESLGIDPDLNVSDIQLGSFEPTPVPTPPPPEVQVNGFRDGGQAEPKTNGLSSLATETVDSLPPLPPPSPGEEIEPNYQ